VLVFRSLQKSDPKSNTFKITYTTSTREVKVFWNDIMVRNVHAFGGSGEEGEVMKLGVMGCSPLGKGTEGVFRDFTLKEV
jgi:regulation of enolase protein 1 (concanavalin A-like superfamily)